MSVAVTEFHETLSELGVSQLRVAQWFGVGPRSIRRWLRGDRATPRAVCILVRLLATRVITIDQIEQAAISIPSGVNGHIQPEPPVEPAPEQSVVPTVLNPTTAQKVWMLGGCRWPHGDPKHPNFGFCDAPIFKKSYCKQHYGAAYMAPRTDGAQDARIRLVAQWSTHHAVAPVALPVPSAKAPNYDLVR
jgi:hypothetical protein